ncbi:hypothetical protein FRACYDRAFT_234367 [Fragilariopsis cylindrus CCMP1102]|uniref:Uncharacterized protein n=1 Tax=Fragilariopsis cylindrus CCMP1102 TaxID=635003 RepID=A0A1E7FRG2_9STRA|nr:hypothetical protein FRACYDRAFT_234367 [Fragilariopsis cylindrus CCMP1102]|eukprot:OEU20736.1 hypothetical protein FRACYDRAFT_234367 [Fragilariopsis cylindrus CCMP1102]
MRLPPTTKKALTFMPQSSTLSPGEELYTKATTKVVYPLITEYPIQTQIFPNKNAVVLVEVSQTDSLTARTIGRFIGELEKSRTINEMSSTAPYCVQARARSKTKISDL